LEHIKIAEAELIQGGRLDRRFKYYASADRTPCDVAGTVLFTFARHTGACSGCSDDREYSAPTKGLGCHECGYHGTVRNTWPVPVFANEVE
jgi:hypothetical protein